MRKDHTDYQNAETRALELFTEEMIKKIEALGSDSKWQQPWLSNGDTMSWPKNISGRPYSGMNAFLLLMMCEKNKWHLPVFCTFNRLVSLNQDKGKDGTDLPRVMVNKGEKATPVFLLTYTCVHKDTKEKIAYEDYKALDTAEKEQYNVYPRTHVYNVFAIDQTNLKEARPELYAKLEEQNTVQHIKVQTGEQFSIPEFDAMIDRQRWICPIKFTNGNGCYYSLSKKEIVVVPKARFCDGETFYNNVSHEAAHSTTELFNRIKLDHFDEKERAAEELKAELSAAMVCNRYGIKKTLNADSAPYLKSWLECLHESPQYLKTILVDVQKMSNTILKRLDEVKLEMKAEKSQNIANTQPPLKNQPPLRDQPPLKNLGTYDIPEWSLPYLINGDTDGIEDFEKEQMDKFTDRFPNGYVMHIDWDNATEFNRYPEFGERNPDALTHRGEPAYCATKTFPVTFYDAILREDKAQEVAQTEQSTTLDTQPEVVAKWGFGR